MPVKLNSTGGGSVTLTTPSTAADYTATFPAGTGNVVVAGSSSALTQGTSQASTSGTSIDFTGIPSWVKRITVMFNGVSANGTSNLLVQIGSTSFTTSGYLGSSTDGPALTATLFTSGFGIRTGSAAAVVHGTVVISIVTGNTWVAAGTLARSDGAAFISTAGTITLSGTLDRLRITTVGGTDTFDAGSINILYE